MWDYQRVFGISIDKQDLEFAATFTVQEEMVGVHWEARYRWLEKNPRK